MRLPKTRLVLKPSLTRYRRGVVGRNIHGQPRSRLLLEQSALSVGSSDGARMLPRRPWRKSRWRRVCWWPGKKLRRTFSWLRRPARANFWRACCRGMSRSSLRSERIRNNVWCSMIFSQVVETSRCTTRPASALGGAFSVQIIGGPFP